MTEFASVSFLILMIIQQLCRVATVIQTKYCPLFEKEWSEKREEIKCKDGEEYFCSLAEDNTFISGCLPPYPIPANSSGCPFVVKSNNLIPHEDKFTPCNENLKGCPPSVHPEYRISQMYKYPLCLKLPSERITSIIAPVEYETRHLTNSTSSVYDGLIAGSDGKNIHITVVIGIALGVVLVAVVVLFAVAGFVLHYVKRTKRAFERSLRGISLGLYGNVEDPKAKNELLPLKENGLNESICNENDSDETTKLPESRTDTFDNGLNGVISKGNDSDEGDERITLLETNTKTTGSSFFDVCRHHADSAAAEILKRVLKEEYENIKIGYKSKITAEEIGKIIDIWEKKHGKPPFRSIADKLISRLNKTSYQ